MVGIDLLIIIIFCIVNSKKAKMLGKSGGAAIAYTIALCVGFEVLGLPIAFVAAFAGYTSFSVIAILTIGASIGGMIAYFIAKSGEPIKTLADSQGQSESNEPPNTGY